MLPAATAPDDAWSRLATRLPVPAAASPERGRRRWRTTLAIAASLALALPVAWWLSSPPTLVAPRHVATQTVTRDATPVAASVDAAPLPRRADPRVAAPSAPLTDAPTPAGHDGIAGRAAPPAHVVAAAVDGAPASLPPATRAPGASDAVARPVADIAVVDGPATNLAVTDDAATTPDTLQRLRGESARLEALVAWARDDRLSSGAATVMTAELDDRLRLIDAALSRPELAEPERASLWSQRVDALQELATLEGTRRWMAVHGTSLDAVARVD